MQALVCIDSADFFNAPSNSLQPKVSIDSPVCVNTIFINLSIRYCHLERFMYFCILMSQYPKKITGYMYLKTRSIT